MEQMWEYIAKFKRGIVCIKLSVIQSVRTELVYKSWIAHVIRDLESVSVEGLPSGLIPGAWRTLPRYTLDLLSFPFLGPVKNVWKITQSKKQGDDLQKIIDIEENQFATKSK